MSNLSRDRLVGKSFDISIGEPWDFVSEAGQNKLVGTVLAISSFDADKDWILLKVSPFNHQKITISHVVGVNRYVSSQDVFSEIEKSNNVTLNFMFPIDGHELKSDTLLADLQNESSLSFLVGSLVSARDSN